VDAEGGLVTSYAQWCGVTQPQTELLFDQEASGKMLEVDASTVATMPLVSADQTAAFSLAACYCPSFHEETGSPCTTTDGSGIETCCERHSEFIQHIGTMYFWTIRICDLDTYQGVDGCARPYRRVLPQQKFVLRVQCPPGGGCRADNNSRIKYVTYTPDSDIPNWRTDHPCKTTDVEPAAIVWPSSNDSLSLGGGDRVDYKLWAAQPVRISSSPKTPGNQFDVCFSNSVGPADFFKIGHVQVSDAFPFASGYTNTTITPTVQFAGVPGTFAFYGGISEVDSGPYDSIPFSGAAQAFFLPYDRELPQGSFPDPSATVESTGGFDYRMPTDFQEQMDGACRRHSASAAAIFPLPAADVALAVAGSANVTSRYQIFRGPGLDEDITVAFAGVRAVCYCALLAADGSGLCEDPEHWIFAGRLTIKGPVGGQEWVLPVGVLSSISILGWGLGADGRLRIIPPSGNCLDNSGLPETVEGEAYKTGCPAQRGLGCKFGDDDTEIELVPLTGLVTGVAVAQVFLRRTYTVIEMAASDRRRRGVMDELRAGDVFSIDFDSIRTNGKTRAQMNPWEQFDTSRLSGEFVYPDTFVPPAVPREFFVGNRVAEARDGDVDGEGQRLVVPLAWESEGRPEFTFPEPGGVWVRRNRADTAEEIRGEAPTEGDSFKVCWGSVDAEQGQEGYTTPVSVQAGSLRFEMAPEMDFAKVYFPSKVSRTVTPIVIAFQTGRERSEYAAVKGKTKLVIRFPDLDPSFNDGQLTPLFADDSLSSCPDYDGCPGSLGDDDEVPYTEARQFLCGKLFSELWTEDGEGFPVTHGCYYSKTYRDQAYVKFQRLRNTNYEGGYIRHYNNIRDYKECEALCAALADCAVYRYCYAPNGCTEGAGTCWQMDDTVIPGMLSAEGTIPGRIVGIRRAQDESGGLFPFYREINIVFNEEYGLKAGTKYMLVMNARSLIELPAEMPLLELYSMCAEEIGCPRPYMVFENTFANSSIQLVVKGNSSHAALSTLPSAEGFQIQAPNADNVLNLAELPVFQFRLTGDGGRVVRPLAILRVHMWPLTQWNLAEGECSAVCIPYHLSSVKQCEGYVGCASELFMDPEFHSHRNVLKIRLPEVMDFITGSVFHTIKVADLALPESGWFPTRVGVQLTREDDTAPQYLTSGGMYWKFPDKGYTESRLVLQGRTGYGPKPFVEQIQNKLLVRLQFGATLWNWGDADLAASVEVKLPMGYSNCHVVGRGEPNRSMEAFVVDSDADGHFDNPFGILSIDEEDGNWERSHGRTCRYDLAKNNRIYHRQVVYFELTVDNPEFLLLKDNPRNVWQHRLISKGAYREWEHAEGATPFYDFIKNRWVPDLPGGRGLWSGNAAVITELKYDLLQPGPTVDSFSLSPAGRHLDANSVQQHIRVFFKPNLEVEPGGYLIVDAPDGFDFGSNCSATPLRDEYYAFYGEFEPMLLALPVEACEGERNPPWASTYNTARIKVYSTLNITELDHWGFELFVSNPSYYEPLQQESWKLWTEDSMARSLEGSLAPVRHSQFHDRASYNFTTPLFQKSWGLYKEALSGVELSFESLEPYRVTDITVASFLFPEDVNTSLRITAPLGYEWSTNLHDFRWFNEDCTGQAPSSVGGHDPCDPFADGDIYGGPEPLPDIEPERPNELVWQSVSLQSNLKYGFQFLVLLPWHSPRTSGNTFFFEFGFDEDDIEKRIKALAIEAPRVATTTTTTTSSTSQTSTTSTTTETTTETATVTTTTTTTMPREAVCDAQFVNVTTGWAVRGTQVFQDPAEGGMLMKTENGGKQWFEMTSGDPRFIGLHFVDPTTAWAVGEAGAIWHSDDGGLAWSAQESSTTERLTGVHMVTEDPVVRVAAGERGRAQRRPILHGWAVGAAGTIVRYNEGYGWSPVESGTSHDLASVHFASKSIGFIVGAAGTILRTDNGGLTWRPQVSGTSEFLHRVRFEDVNVGWVFGVPGLAFRTTDGGETWRPWY